MSGPRDGDGGGDGGGRTVTLNSSRQLGHVVRSGSDWHFSQRTCPHLMKVRARFVKQTMQSSTS